MRDGASLMICHGDDRFRPIGLRNRLQYSLDQANEVQRFSRIQLLLVFLLHQKRKGQIVSQIVYQVHIFLVPAYSIIR